MCFAWFFVGLAAVSAISALIETLFSAWQGRKLQKMLSDLRRLPAGIEADRLEAKISQMLQGIRGAAKASVDAAAKQSLVAAALALSAGFLS